MDPSTGLIDYPALERNAELFKPKMIVAGISCYSRKQDYARYCAVLHCTAILHCTALHCTALHYTALHCTALYSAVFYSLVHLQCTTV